MSNLETIRLGDLLAEQPAYGANASALQPNGIDPRYLRITDIDDQGRLLHCEIRCIPSLVARNYILQDGDIVIARTGNTVGKSYLHKSQNGLLAFAGYLIRFRIDKAKGDPFFVFHFLHSSVYWTWIQNTLRTGAQPNINSLEYKNLTIPKLPLPHQRKIAKILTTVDNLIEKTESLIAKYQSIKQGMMHDLFTRGVDAKGKLRPSQSDAPELYKQSELGWIPKDWEVERLENHLDRIDQGWSPDCDSEPATAGEWGVLKTTAVVWNGFNDLENKKLPKHLKPEPNYEVKVNDVLMTRGGPNSRVGVVVFVNETRSRLMLSDKIYRISLKQSVLPNYIALALSSKSTQIHLSTLKTGLAESQTNISQKIVKQLLVSIPNLKEQLIICKHIRKTEDFLNSNLRTLLEWKTIKTALMQDLLTGRVQVTPDEIDKELAHA